MCVIVATHWSTVNLPGVTPLENTDSSSPSSPQLSIAPHLGVEADKDLSPLWWNADWLALA